MKLLQDKKSRTKKRTKHAQKGGMTSPELLDRFRSITNAINCIGEFSYYETAFIELQRILKVIQTQTSNVLTLTMHFPNYDELYGIFPNNKATAYGYLLHSFRKNYVYLLEKYTQEKDSHKKVHLHYEIQKFYKSYMIVFMYFFLEYLTDKQKKHSADFEHNTQLMCSEFPKLIQDIQEYLKKVIPNPDIINTLNQICSPVKEAKAVIQMVDPKIIKQGSKNNEPRLYARIPPINTIRLPAYSADPNIHDEGIDSITEDVPFTGLFFNRTPAVTKTGKRILVPIAPAIPEESIDDYGNVYFPFDHRRVPLSNRLPKQMYLPPPRSASVSRPRSASAHHARTLRLNSLGGIQRKRKTRKIV